MGFWRQHQVWRDEDWECWEPLGTKLHCSARALGWFMFRSCAKMVQVRGGGRCPGSKHCVEGYTESLWNLAWQLQNRGNHTWSQGRTRSLGP